VAESNINRQIQALGATVGQAKVDAMAERIADIHPGCRVHRIEDFVTPENWPTCARPRPAP
jgi:tRNA A37 threonylcarbamoyladenosine dehydratase